MNQHSQQMAPELMAQMRGMFLGMFGGPEKLDCWLTTTAEELADPHNPELRPIALDRSMIPEQFQALMHRPREVVDTILEKLEVLLIFEYQARIVECAGAFKFIVLDKVSGHSIEEMEGLDPDNLIHSLMEKYGSSLEITE